MDQRTKRGMYVIGAAALATFGMVALTRDDAPDGSASAQTAGAETANRPAYDGSRQINVIVAGFTPSSTTTTMVGKAMMTSSRPARVRLIGKNGLDVSVALPPRCDTVPVTARLGRPIRVRQDLWRTGSSVSGQMSVDDAVAALCDEAGTRDVAVPRKAMSGKTAD